MQRRQIRYVALFQRGTIDMTSTYPDQLAEWVKRRDAKRGPSRVSEFLALRDDVEAAIRAGFDIKAIWSEMREAGRVSVGYSTFLAYVSRYSSTTLSAPVDVVKKAAKFAEQPSVVSTSRLDGNAFKKVGVAPVRGFTFNPDPKKEDLI